MTKINFTSTSLCVRNEDLTPFRKAAQAINRLGKNVRVYSTPDSSPASIHDIYTYSDIFASVQGSKFVVEEQTVKKRGKFKGQSLYMTFYDGYKITENGVILHNCGNDSTLHIVKQ